MAIHREQRRADARGVLDEFEKWLLRERSAQKRTAGVYIARVAGFAEWLPAPTERSLRKLTAATVIEWVNLEAARGLKASTLSKLLVMLRSFLQFCHRSGRTGQDLSGVVPHAAAWRLSSIPDPVPAGTIEALFNSLDLRSPKGLRDRAILLLLTGLGLRACEIAGLRLDDIGWRTATLRIRGKGDRVDELPLPDEVGQALEDHVLDGRGGRVEGEEVFWTVIDPVQPLSANGVCGDRPICIHAGVTKFGPHRLRHTFATGMLASGATLQEVQGLLRHANYYSDQVGPSRSSRRPGLRGAVRGFRRVAGMSEQRVDVVVFDIGGVLLDWSPDYLYGELIPDAGEREHFLTNIANGEWNKQQDAGRSWSEAVAELSSLHPEHAEWIEAYDKRWLKMVKGVFDDTVELIAEIREKKIPNYALTNFSHDKWEVAKAAFPVLTGFDGEVVSGAELTTKPDEKIYRILLDRFDLDPARTFYTDDVQTNVDGARAVGIDAELFTNAKTLRTHLTERGLPLRH